MAAESARVRKIVELVSALTDDENEELEVELLSGNEAVTEAWGAEIDRRAARALEGAASALSRRELLALLEMPSAEARARIEQMRARR